MKIQERKCGHPGLPGTGSVPGSVHLAMLLLTCSISFTTSAAVFKWIDENGRTHYSDKAGKDNARTLKITGPPARDPDHHSHVEKQRRLLKMLDEEHQETKQRKAEAAAEKLKHDANCARAQKDLQAIQNARFLYKRSKDPYNPAVYTREQRSKITDAAKKAVQHWCK